MRKFGLLGLWIRSALVGPLALILGFLLVYLLASWLKRRRSGTGFGGLASVLAFAGTLFVLCLPYPAYVIELPLLRWSARVTAAANQAASRQAPLHPERPTVVFVLGGGISPKTSLPSSYSLGRLDYGLRIWRQAPDAFLLFTDGGLSMEKGAEWMRQYLLQAGVPADRILLEDRAATTQQNFIFGRELLVERGLGEAQLILVTSASHVPRAYHTARRYGLQPQVAPLDERTDLTCHPSWFSLLQLSALLNEYLGVAGYKLLGWL